MATIVSKSTMEQAIADIDAASALVAERRKFASHVWQTTRQLEPFPGKVQTVNRIDGRETALFHQGKRLQEARGRIVAALAGPAPGGLLSTYEAGKEAFHVAAIGRREAIAAAIAAQTTALGAKSLLAAGLVRQEEIAAVLADADAGQRKLNEAQQALSAAESHEKGAWENLLPWTEEYRAELAREIASIPSEDDLLAGIKDDPMLLSSVRFRALWLPWLAQPEAKEAEPVAVG